MTIIDESTSARPPVIEAAELAEMCEVVRRFASSRESLSRARTSLTESHGHDRSAWSAFAGDLGLAGLLVPESLGGIGGGAIELLPIAEELGRTLLSVPFLSTAVLAAPLLALAPSGQQFMPDMLDGTRTATVVIDAGGPTWSVGADGVTVDESGLARGTARSVPDAADSDILVVVNQGRVAVLDSADPQVKIRSARHLDETLREGVVEIRDANSRVLDGFDDVLDEGMARVWAYATLAVASTAVGAAAAAMERSVEYASQRYAFGRPIGSFQATKHRCARMLCAVEAGRAVLGEAANILDDAVDARSTEVAMAVSAAAAYCGDAGSTVTADAVHVHGGIGATWEHDCHLWYRRTFAARSLFGTPADHRDRIAQLLVSGAA